MRDPVTNEKIDSFPLPLGERQIVFLMYENRSGSTFLASRLDLHEEVAVTIETEAFADLLETGPEIREEADIDRVVDTFFGDDKFARWNIDRKTLRFGLEVLTRPAKFEMILRKVLDLHFDGLDVPYYLVKGTRLTHHIARLRREIPSAKYLHIIRDPRGVFGSQKQSIGSYTARAMNEDPYDAAKRWAANAGRVDRVAGDDLMEVRYEDLITDHDATMQSIRDFVRRKDLPPLTDPGELDGEAYLSKIPEDQRHLHQNLLKKPRADRIEAWREELSDIEIALTQQGAGDMLEKKGYAADREAVRRAGRMAVAMARAGLALRTAGRRLGNVVRYARSGKLFWRIRVVLYRWRA
ncbi:MAG: sulfotransferase family protein [Minwuia sp.]|uniref:sulfotransferase family protein n=1 Tax=Minwuia sp. TaxID=2493630 RepID=UPI003A83F55C